MENESNLVSTDPVQPMSLGARMVNVVVAPGEVFDALKGSPPAAANWLVPALIYMVVGWLGATLVFSQDWVKPAIVEMQAAAMQQRVDSGKMTQAQADQARDALERYGMVGATVSGYAAPLVLGLAGPFFWGLILWLIGSKILKGGFGYMKAVEVAGLTAVIAALGSLVRTLLILIQGNLTVSLSAALLIPEPDPTNLLHAYAGVVDAMMIWGLAVKSMGIARLAGRSTGAVAAWVIPFWFLFAGGLATLGWLAQKLSG